MHKRRAEEPDRIGKKVTGNLSGRGSRFDVLREYNGNEGPVNIQWASREKVARLVRGHWGNDQ